MKKFFEENIGWNVTWLLIGMAGIFIYSEFL